MTTTFRKAVEATLGSWNPLQFAVQQQTGGKESAAIAEWMVGVSEQYFYENEDLEEEEVADYLATIMDQELNTMVEDESDVEVGRKLCHFYSLCTSGREAQVMEELAKMPKSDLSLCKVQDSTEEGMETTQGVAASMSGLQLGDSSNEEGSTEATQQLTELQTQQLHDEAEGWTVIKRDKRRNK